MEGGEHVHVEDAWEVSRGWITSCVPLCVHVLVSVGNAKNTNAHGADTSSLAIPPKLCNRTQYAALFGATGHCLVKRQAA